VIKVFEKNENKISSAGNNLGSNEVLDHLRKDLENAGFSVETGKKNDEKIKIPVLYGLNGKIEKSFDVDALNSDAKTVIEVEAGRGVENNQFLKDLFQVCVMTDIEYLAIAVRLNYRKKNNFKEVIKFIDSLYSSSRLIVPLKGLLIIGY